MVVGSLEDGEGQVVVAGLGGGGGTGGDDLGRGGGKRELLESDKVS